jgi:hypothetical protein
MKRVLTFAVRAALASMMLVALTALGCGSADSGPKKADSSEAKKAVQEQKDMRNKERGGSKAK